MRKGNLVQRKLLEENDFLVFDGADGKSIFGICNIYNAGFHRFDDLFLSAYDGHFVDSYSRILGCLNDDIIVDIYILCDIQKAFQNRNVG